MADIIYEKYYVEKALPGFISPYRDPFRYQSMRDSGVEELESTLDRILSDTKSRDLQGKTGRDELRLLVDLAEGEFKPDNWFHVFLGSEPVGLVLPQRFPDSLEEGTLFILGITSQFRGNGFAKIIHAKGLQCLASMGIKRYVGSTDVENEAMIKIFSANECRYLGIRQLDSNGNHIGWRNRPEK